MTRNTYAKDKAPARQLTLNLPKSWGGKRRGAGRPNLSGTVNHMKRSQVSLKTPLHINMKLKERLPSLRRKELFREFKKSVELAKAQGFYVIHFSVQRDHIHLFAEAENNKTLGLGMRSLAGRFAKSVRQHVYLRSKMSQVGESSCPKKGSVFKGRYHLHVLKTPKETRNALEYVLLNQSKHLKLIEFMDFYSSARYFKYWPKLLGVRFKHLIKSDTEFYQGLLPRRGKNIGNEVKSPTPENEFLDGSAKLPFRVGDDLDGTPCSSMEILSPPRSWLAQKGWMRVC